MDATYFVKKVDKCAKCEGRQFVQHPAWTEYWEENQNKQPMSLEEDRKWFEGHGWYQGSCIDIGTDGLPDEEIICSECEGQGEIETEVNLMDVLPQMLEAINLKVKE